MTVIDNKAKSAFIVKVLVAAVGMSSFQVVAQDKDAGNRAQLEEIIITATKRETNLQETPLSISIVSGQDLSQIAADEIIDYFSSVPGLSIVDEGPGERRIVIRGIQGVGQAQTGLYYDETFVTGSPGTENDSGARQPDLKLIDIERVEVLKGPQGTLYGSSSVGGTVRVITKKPKLDQFEGFIEGGLASTEDGDESSNVSFMANIPLVDNKVALRLVGYFSDDGGYIDNVGSPITNNPAQEDVNDFESAGGRIALTFKASENLTIDAKAILQRSDGGSRANYLPVIGELQTQRAISEFVEDDTDIYNLTATWDTDAFSLVATSSYYERELVINFDGTLGFSGFPFVPASDLPIVVNQPQDVDNWTNEIRLSSNGEGNLLWTVGIFTESRDSFVNSQFFAGTASGDMQPDGLRFRRFVDETLDQLAVFGELTYDITDRISLTGGLRWFDYDIETTNRPFVGFYGNVLTPDAVASGTVNVDTSESDVLFKLGASYDVNDDLMFYGTIAEGFRPGGANQQVIDGLTPASFLPDNVTNYEIGLKSTLANGRINLNVALYRLVWEDIQVGGTVEDPIRISFTGNAGEAEIDGLELELQMQLTDALLISGGFNYQKPEFSEDQIDANGFFTNNTARAGDNIPYVPEFSASLSTTYNFQMNSNWDGFARLDYNYQDDRGTEFNASNSSFRLIDDYSLLNGSIGFSNDNWNITIFARNIANKLALTNIDVNNVGRDEVYIIRPRTVGINVKRSF